MTERTAINRVTLFGWMRYHWSSYAHKSTKDGHAYFMVNLHREFKVLNADKLIYSGTDVDQAIETWERTLGAA
jgi:hypothetical protein